MESLSDRGTAMKQLLLDCYKEKLFANVNITAGQEKNKSEFAKAFLECMSKQSSLLSRGVTTETLAMIRSRFILEWFDKYAGWPRSGHEKTRTPYVPLRFRRAGVRDERGSVPAFWQSGSKCFLRQKAW